MSDDEYIDFFENVLFILVTQRWSNERTGSNGVIRIVDEYTYNNQFCRVGRQILSVHMTIATQAVKAQLVRTSSNTTLLGGAH